jgi:glycosyltransferase involved in cell wall biosynthesis
MPNEPSRNQPCPCGSGRRFKDCHGRPGADTTDEAVVRQQRVAQLMSDALAHQKARRTTEAERSYRAALELQPGHPDALHMLGVICLERGDRDRAKAYVLRALEATAWKIRNYRHNLALIVADEYPPQVWDAVLDRAQRYRVRTARHAAAGGAFPLVSVLVACDGNARYVEQALRSVYEQSYRNIEIVVIDDESGDGSDTVIKRCLAVSPFPNRFVAGEHRGAATTLNEAASLSTGTFIHFLNADDWIEPDRVRRMVESVAGAGEQWGFSSVRCVDLDGEEIDPLRHRYVFDLYCAIADSPARQTLGFAMLAQNIAASLGNLFVSRDLFAAVGGFRDYRYTYAWDLCLRALRIAEPVWVPQALYNYRLHEENDAAAVAAPARAEAEAICGAYLEWACGPAVGAGEFAPCVRNFGPVFVKILFESSLSDLVAVDTLRGLAQSQP